MMTSATNARRRDTGLMNAATKEEDVDAAVAPQDHQVRAIREEKARRRAAEEEDPTLAQADPLHLILDQKRPPEEEDPPAPNQVLALRRESALTPETLRYQSQARRKIKSRKRRHQDQRAARDLDPRAKSKRLEDQEVDPVTRSAGEDLQTPSPPKILIK